MTELTQNTKNESAAVAEIGRPSADRLTTRLQDTYNSVEKRKFVIYGEIEAYYLMSILETVLVPLSKRHKKHQLISIRRCPNHYCMVSPSLPRFICKNQDGQL